MLSHPTYPSLPLRAGLRAGFKGFLKNSKQYLGLDKFLETVMVFVSRSLLSQLLTLTP